MRSIPKTRNRIRGSSGQATVEYLLMLAMIVGVVIVLSIAFRSALPKIFGNVLSATSVGYETKGGGRSWGKNKSSSCSRSKGFPAAEKGGSGCPEDEENQGFVFAGIFEGKHGAEIGVFKQDQGKPALTDLAQMANWMLPKVTKSE